MRILERATNKRKLELVAIARKRFKVSDKIEHGADMEALQAIGRSQEEEQKQSLVSPITPNAADVAAQPSACATGKSACASVTLTCWMVPTGPKLDRSARLADFR